MTTMYLHRLMFLSIQGPHPDNFDALGAVHRWWGSSVKARRPGFTPWSSLASKDEMEAQLEELALLNAEDATEGVTNVGLSRVMTVSESEDSASDIDTDEDGVLDQCTRL